MDPRDASPRHGGDLAFATARYGLPEGGWLDLSTGINPVPYPAAPVTAAALARLPDGGALAGLIRAARTAYGAPEDMPLVAVPGSESAIRLLPYAAPEGSVAIVGPTYGSHSRAWRAAGRSVVEVTAIPEAPVDAVIVVVANPNNPNGRVVPSPALLDATAQLGRGGGFLIVDEAFADVVPEASILPALGDAPVLVLRSFGKFFGLAGLRLGFVAGRHAAVQRLAELAGDWPVSNAAIAIGTEALGDIAWQEAARARIGSDAARLGAMLRRHGLILAGDGGLFLLVTDQRAAALHDALARNGIWTRVFPDHPDWLRIGLPSSTGFDRLDAALGRVLAGLR